MNGVLKGMESISPPKGSKKPRAMQMTEIVPPVTAQQVRFIDAVSMTIHTHWKQLKSM